MDQRFTNLNLIHLGQFRGGQKKKEKYMNIFSLKKTTMSIKDNKLTENKKFLYFFIFSMGTMAPAFLKGNETEIAYDIAYYLIALTGLMFCFFSNKNNDNNNFIERFVILSIPSYISSLFYFVFLSCIIFGGFLLFDIKVDNINYFLPYLNALPHLVCVFIYIRIYCALKSI